MRHTTTFAALGVTGLLTLVGCSSSSGDSPTVSGAQTASSTTTVAVATTGGSTASTTSTSAAAPATTATTEATATKASANNATQADVQKALEAAGVSNAARWAVEVVEYRPYPTNDPTFAKLRQNLAKYNPAPGLVDQIITALSL